MNPSVLMFAFFMCSKTACAITSADCGKRNVHLSLPGGNAAGDSASCTVSASAATGAIAIAIGVAADPRIRSTLSSVTKRRAFFTPLAGSVASSRTIRLIFSPAIVCGHSASWFLIGTPRPDAGPLNGRLTPIVTSARAAPAARATTAPAATSTAARWIRFNIVSSVSTTSCRLFAQRANVGWNLDRAQAAVLALDERSRFAAFAQHFVAAQDCVVLHENLGTPLLHPRMHFDPFRISRRAHELDAHFEQRCADDAARLFQFAPRRHAADREEIQRSGVHPAQEVGIEHDSRGVAVAELDGERKNDDLAHRDRYDGGFRLGRRRLACAAAAESTDRLHCSDKAPAPAQRVA